MLNSMRRLVRSLAHRRLFTLFSVMLLALGVGAVHAILAIISVTVLRPLPYQAPSELVAVQSMTAATRDSMVPLPLAAMQLIRWREQTQTLVQLEGYTPGTFAISDVTGPMPVSGALVSAGLFDVLGVHAVLGHGFRRADEQPHSGTAVISFGFWQRRFSGRRDVIGSSVVVDGEPRTIIGVMPRDFTLAFQPGDLWLPMTLGASEIATTRLRVIAGIGRLRPGVPIARSTSDLDAINAALADEFPDAFRTTKANVRPLRDALLASQRNSLMLLSLAVALVILIAAANVVSLSLADVMHRRLATLTRLAFGASRVSILRARLLDAAVIAVVATAIGLLIGRIILAALLATNSEAFVATPQIDTTVIVITVASGLIVGLATAVPAAMVEASFDVGSIASAVSRAVGGVSERRVREGLVAVQMAITLMLLVGATLMVRQARDLLVHSPGFDPTNVVAVRLTVSNVENPTPKERGLYVGRLLDAIRATPGVNAASSLQTRFVLNETMQTNIAVDGKPTDPAVEEIVNIRNVMSDLFSTLRIAVRQGRGIDATDLAESRPVAVVSTSLARKYWGVENALGKRIRRTARADAPWLDVVGVVDDIEDQGAGVSSGPTLYVPYLQQNTPTVRVTIVARVRGAPDQMLSRIRDAIWSANRGQAIDDVTPLQTLLVQSTAMPRFQALILSLFGGAAVVLVLCGVYALTLFGVMRRTRELGVRAALGAPPGGLVRFSMWQGLRAMLAGLLAGSIGLVLMVWMAPSGLRPHVSITDLSALALVGVALLGSGCLAAFLPAQRATRISPMLAMRQ